MPEAAKDFQRLAKSEPKAFAKANSMLKELESHPKSGTGHQSPSKVSQEADGAENNEKA